MPSASSTCLSFGLNQSLNARKAIIAAKSEALCHRGRFEAGGSGICMLAAERDCSLRRKITAIRRPMMIPNTMAPITRATPSSKPSTRAMRKTASTLIAGPA